MNALTALLRVNDLGLDARKSLSGSQILEVSRWRIREEPLAVSVARSEAVRLAKRIGELDAKIKANGSRITELVEVSEAAPLLQDWGVRNLTLQIERAQECLGYSSTVLPVFFWSTLWGRFLPRI